MKKYILSSVFAFIGLVSLAQDINLTDSVIYFDKKPVAYYVKEINASNPHYNIYIISLERKLLIAAQVVKFEAPIRELKSFYYYEVIFQNEKDTFSIYHEGQAFSLELASLIKQHKLLDSNKINRRALVKFKREYSGNASLKTKIKEYETYLNDTRFFDEQVVRDRTKPITIENDKIIMQDGKKIGLISTTSNFKNGNAINADTRLTSSNMLTPVQAGNTMPSDYTQYVLPTNRVVDASKVLIESRASYHKPEKRPTLFDISLPLNKSSANEDTLWYICQLVDKFLL